MENSFQREVLERLTKIETKLDDYKELKNEAQEALNLSNTNSSDIKDIKDELKWMKRTIAGSIIAGVIGIVFVVVKIGLGIN